MRRLGPTLLLSLALLAGCGDDEKDKKPAAAAKTAEPPKAKESLQAAADDLAKVAPDGSCAELVNRLLPTSLRGPTAKPGDPPTPELCKSVEGSSKALAGFKPTRVQEYGPVGVVEASASGVRKGHVLASTWVIDQDGVWRAMLFGDFDPQIGEKPLPESNFDEVVEEYVDAARKGECDTVFKLASPQSRFVTLTKNDVVKYCNTVSESYKKPDSALHDLAGDPNAKPEKLGETLDFAWYAVRMNSGRYWVIQLTTRPEGDLDPKLAEGHPGKVQVSEYVTLTAP